MPQLQLNVNRNLSHRVFRHPDYLPLSAKESFRLKEGGAIAPTIPQGRDLNLMKDNPPILIILQLLPILVVLTAIVNPNLALPLIALLAVLFPVILYKFIQQASRDLGRELYSRNPETTRFENWDEVPIFDQEPSAVNPLFQRIQADLARLRLAYPFDEEQLTQAYRRRARETHPDAGGSEREFIEVREAYERLQEVLDLEIIQEF
ncbi:DnaJ domain-containing protein [Sodalinema gerasimenkoae]|uniref:DnaJ domain-containing protein n=1 Tax=Sodalinema gerasimenkoae TaxID=2862348 RepID=UPI001C642590|nr:J domain-containing protein [Sodalinema gerasimenkoae]